MKGLLKISFFFQLDVFDFVFMSLNLACNDSDLKEVTFFVLDTGSVHVKGAPSLRNT